MLSGDHILLPLTYLGPVSYYGALLNAGSAELELHEHYVKQTYRNRCTIMTANGPLDLIIPVVKVNGNHTAMKDAAIPGQGKWQLMHWRAIEAAYSKSPYFLFFREEIEVFYHQKFQLLSEFTIQLTELLLEFVGIEKEMDLTTAFIKNPGPGTTDLRNAFDPKKEPSIDFPEYDQVFSDRFGFLPDLSVIDLLFNAGPDALQYLMDLKFTTP